MVAHATASETVPAADAATVVLRTNGHEMHLEGGRELLLG